MATDPLTRLEAVIAASAHERDIKDQQVRDDQAAKERQRNEARAIWSERKKELVQIVKAIDGMLKDHGYAGLVMGSFDLKHTDIDRVVIEFEHSVRNHSKILLCVTRAGEFTCSIGAVASEVASTKLPIEQLTEDELKEALARAVVVCLGGARTPGSEQDHHPAETAR